MTQTPEIELTHARWPLRRVYPVLGVLLAAGAPAGLLAARSVAFGAVPTADWAVAELASASGTYGYLALFTAAVLAAVGYALGRREDQMRSLSVTDPLTGLYNRRHFEERFAEELERRARQGTPLSILAVDLDCLKAINDGQGHRAGDRALFTVARAMRDNLRTMDVASRHGGDEFLVLCPHTPAREALAVAERIRQEVERLGEEEFGGTLSVSIGVASLEGAGGAARAEELFLRADRALYEAKAAGRNRTVVASAAAATSGGEGGDASQDPLLDPAKRAPRRLEAELSPLDGLEFTDAVAHARIRCPLSEALRTGHECRACPRFIGWCLPTGAGRIALVCHCGPRKLHEGDHRGQKPCIHEVEGPSPKRTCDRKGSRSSA